MKRKILSLILCIFATGLIVAHAQEVSKTNSKALSTRFIPKLNQNVTFIGLGALEIGRDWGIGSTERFHATPSEARKVLQTALQDGITVIDTANSYHASESFIGQFAPKSQYNYLLMTKTGESSILANDPKCKKPASDNQYCAEPASNYDFSSQAIRQDVDNSLKNLRSQKLDVVLIHFGPDPEKVLDKGEAVATLKELQREGKIRYIGASLDDPTLVKRCIESNDFDVIEFEYNLLNRANEENIKLANEKGMAVIVRGALGTGLLTPKVKAYLNDPSLPFRKELKDLLALTDNDFDKLMGLELKFLYQNKGISSVLIGARTPAELNKDISLLNNFNNNALIDQAEKMTRNNKFNTFTNSVDAYFK